MAARIEARFRDLQDVDWASFTEGQAPVLSGDVLQGEDVGAGAVEAHNDDTTFVHGIIDTAALSTTAGSRLEERADPPAPGANVCIVYCRDDGSGNTELCVRFATGPVQVIATEDV